MLGRLEKPQTAALYTSLLITRSKRKSASEDSGPGPARAAMWGHQPTNQVPEPQPEAGRGQHNRTGCDLNPESGSQGSLPLACPQILKGITSWESMQGLLTIRPLTLFPEENSGSIRFFNWPVKWGKDWNP